MFETRYPFSPTAFASKLELLDQGYPDCWKGLKKNFDPERKDGSFRPGHDQSRESQCS